MGVWRKVAPWVKWSLQHAGHVGKSAGTWYSRRGGPYFKPATTVGRHVGHFGRSAYSTVKGYHDYYKVGRDLHVARALESPWKLSMYTFKVIRRVAPWALSSGYFISRLVNWTPAQKKYFIYCIQQELRYARRISPRAFYTCVRKADAIQTRKVRKKSLRNDYKHHRRY